MITVARDEPERSPKVEKLITLTEASERTGVSIVTLRKIVRNQGITLYRNPRDARERLVDADEIDAAMKPTPIRPELDDTKKAAA